MPAGELTRRWLVAIVGVPVVIGLLWVGGWVLAVPIAALAALGADEVYRLAARTGAKPFRWTGMTAAAVLVLAAAPARGFAGFAPLALVVLGATTVLLLVAAMARRGPARGPLAAVSSTLFGAVYVGLPLACVPILHALPTLRGWGPLTGGHGLGLMVVALPLAATWVGDAVAFFAGSAWGDAKVAPSISPKKSWVGVWAGLLGAGLAGLAWYLVVEARLPGLPLDGALVAFSAGALLGAGAQVGDFAESLLKREAGVKDSGRLFPGHGGVLDRLDALVVTLPAALALLAFLESAP